MGGWRRGLAQLPLRRGNLRAKSFLAEVAMIAALAAVVAPPRFPVLSARATAESCKEATGGLPHVTSA